MMDDSTLLPIAMIAMMAVMVASAVWGLLRRRRDRDQ
jgi:LPXTG-motif cell wall-anchored protein